MSIKITSSKLASIKLVTIKLNMNKLKLNKHFSYALVPCISVHVCKFGLHTTATKVASCSTLHFPTTNDEHVPEQSSHQTCSMVRFIFEKSHHGSARLRPESIFFEKQEGVVCHLASSDGAKLYVFSALLIERLLYVFQ